MKSIWPSESKITKTEETFVSYDTIIKIVQKELGLSNEYKPICKLNTDIGYYPTTPLWDGVTFVKTETT